MAFESSKKLDDQQIMGVAGGYILESQENNVLKLTIQEADRDLSNLSTLKTNLYQDFKNKTGRDVTQNDSDKITTFAQTYAIALYSGQINVVYVKLYPEGSVDSIESIYI